MIDPISGNIYGVIIAMAPEAQESYMLCASQVMDSIKEMMSIGTDVTFPPNMIYYEKGNNKGGRNIIYYEKRNNIGGLFEPTQSDP